MNVITVCAATCVRGCGHSLMKTCVYKLAPEIDSCGVLIVCIAFLFAKGLHVGKVIG